MRSIMHKINITKKEIDKFHTDGFIIFENIIDPKVAKEAVSRFTPLFSGDFETGIQPDKIKWLKGRDSEDAPRSMCNVWKSDRTIAKITLDEKIGEIAATLMGWSGTRANQDNAIWIPPSAGRICHHQDDSYQDWHEPDGIITCWIALENTSVDGGTLEYVKGSHKWPLSSRVNTFTAPEDYRAELDIAAKQVGVEVELVPVVVPSGGGSFHHGRLWHGSNYNQTDKSRYCVSTHCMDSESHFHPEIPSPMYNHYKRFGDLTMDESFFPILWTQDGRRSEFLEGYLG